MKRARLEGLGGHRGNEEYVDCFHLFCSFTAKVTLPWCVLAGGKVWGGEEGQGSVSVGGVNLQTVRLAKSCILWSYNALYGH